MVREVWDAYDKHGKKLGFDMYRDEYDKAKKDVFHLVVEVFTVTKNKEVLITKRDKNKESYPLKWEITGGSALKGESGRIASKRELFEETGISTDSEKLIPVYELYCKENVPALYSCYINIIPNKDINVILQEGETCDYKFITYSEFKKFIKEKDFSGTFKYRFFEHEDIFNKIIENIH